MLPGLGHLYKHQWHAGQAILTAGNLIAGLFTGLLFFATLGIGGILLPALWITWVAYDAYHEPDWSHRAKSV